MCVASDIRAIERKSDLVSAIYTNGGTCELFGCFQVDEVGPFEDGDRPGKYMERHATLIGAWDDNGVVSIDDLVSAHGIGAVRNWEKEAVE